MDLNLAYDKGRKGLRAAKINWRAAVWPRLPYSVKLGYYVHGYDEQNLLIFLAPVVYFLQSFQGYNKWSGIVRYNRV